MKSYAEDVGKSMGDAMYDFITGAKSASQAVGEFVSNLLKNALKILTQWLAMYAIYSAFPYFYKAYSPADLASETVFGIKAQHKAQGGLISGPGGFTSDSIPAMLSNGEYVMRASAVQSLGTDTLDAMNNGVMPNNNNVSLNVSAVDASSFGDFLDRGGLDKIKQALFENNRQFASESGVW